MGKYAVHRIDNNAAERYSFLEAHGVAVEKTPGGPLDAIAAVDGATAVIDVKGHRFRLTPRQVKFFERWPGLKMLVETETDCLKLIQKLREMARRS